MVSSRQALECPNAANTPVFTTWFAVSRAIISHLIRTVIVIYQCFVELPGYIISFHKIATGRSKSLCACKPTPNHYASKL